MRYGSAKLHKRKTLSRAVLEDSRRAAFGDRSDVVKAEPIFVSADRVVSNVCFPPSPPQPDALIYHHPLVIAVNTETCLFFPGQNTRSRKLPSTGTWCLTDDDVLRLSV